MNFVFFLDTFVITDKSGTSSVNTAFIKVAKASRNLMTVQALAPAHSHSWRLRCSLWGLAICALVATALPLQALAQSDRLGNSPSSPIHAFGQTFAQPRAVVAQQLRMVFYRTEQSSSVPGAASIYVNGAYHASLVAGGYSELCLPAGGAEVAVKSVEIGRTVKDKLDTITALPSIAGQSVYLRVQEAAKGRQLLQPVPVAQALQELAGAREQTHTISRVPEATDCVANSTAERATPAPSSQTITLAADALFAFARADLQGISPAGRASLDALAQRLRSEYIQLDRLHIVGHADPLGQPAPNERLAWDRAQTVREYLMRSLGLWGQGASAERITSEGRGSREPVALSCPLQATPSAIECHAPNRRVVIQVSGTRR
jgi:OOP family OmpA-OmpF porin